MGDGNDTGLDDEISCRLKKQWLEEQNAIKAQITTEDDKNWCAETEILVGGLDISFIVGDVENACAGYVVIDSQFKTVYKETKMVKMTDPYIPGFLAFREANFLCDMVREQKRNEPELTPSLLMIDGNGILHPNRAGIASHIGVILQIPTIGVAKNLHMLPELGISNKKSICDKLQQKGDKYDLCTDQGELLGSAVKTMHTGHNPVFVSVGTGLSLKSAVDLVLRFSDYRVPEPTRQADIISREYLRLNHPTARQIQPKKKKGRQKEK